MNGNIKKNVTRRAIWLRLCFMIIMSIAFSVAELVIFVVVVFQFFCSLLTGKTNDRLVRLGRNLARYVQQITAYVTFTTEDIPFPFMPWPDEPHVTAEEEDEDGPDDAPATDTVAADDEAETEDTAVDDTPSEEEPSVTETEPVKEPSVEAAGESADVPDLAGEEVPEERAADTKPAETSETAVFSDGAAYDKFMGERSKQSGERLLAMLDPPPRLSWLDVGCGTGALSAAIMDKCDPSALIGVDSSEEQIAHAKDELNDSRADFRVADATALPFEIDSFDVAVSSYVMNFVANKQRMVDEMARVVRPEGTVAVTVFDVAGGRQTTYPIWELIGRNDPAFHKAEFEKRGWNITNPDDLTAFFENAGLEEVTVDSIEIDETFADFDEYWSAMTIMPTSGTSLYVNKLSDAELENFKADLRALMPIQPDGSIKLITGSWVVRGKVPA